MTNSSWLLLFLAAPYMAQAQRPADLYQRAVVLERAAGKLDSAIGLYQRVVKESGADRALAARALIRLGGAYELLGRTEALAAYNRVLREFGDQRELVAQARQRVAALDRAGRAGVIAASSGPTARRVWEGSVGGAPIAAPSPDGRLLAFTDRTTGDLAIRDLGPGTNRILTRNARPSGPDQEYAENMTFSPNGREIAYTWWNGKSYDVRVVGVNGGESRQLFRADVAAVFAWSAAGDRILGIVNRGLTAELSWIDPRDGRRVLIRELRSWPVNVSVSPDGRWIVFDELSRDQPLADYELRIVAADGSGFGPLLEHSAGDWHPFWTPDGRGVAFLSDRSGSRGVWFVAMNNGKARGDPVMLKGDMGSNLPIGFAGNGSLFYATKSTVDVQVATLDPETGDAAQPLRFVSRAYLGSHSNPDWSPDGRTLALILMRGSGTGAPYSRVIELLDVESGSRRVLTPNLAQVFLPRWSPDGASLLVWGIPIESTARAGFFSVDVATGSLSTVYLGRNYHGISAAGWSADGRAIYYVRQDSLNDEVWRFDRADSSHHRVYADKSVRWIRAVSASPTGSAIAFSTSMAPTGGTGSGPSARVLSLADGTVRDVQVPVAGTTITGNWTRDGALMVAVPRAADKTFELWRLPVNGSAPRKLGFDAPTLGTMRTSRDGRRIAIMAESPTTDRGVWVIDGLLPPAPNPPRPPRPR